ncbi:MAG: flagellar hook basal-body protein [Candidatus Margulisbacteria bacterium]|nr:flagellar hook basal-body protein [Candidatus Margulisiibacteriota bacterium]
MSDPILEIGCAGLDGADQDARTLMDNIVSAQLPGYQKSSVVKRSFPLELEIAQQKFTFLSPMKPRVEDSYRDTTHGALMKTENQLDCAIGGDGYFVVEGNWGMGFTRDGRFLVDKDGRLLTTAGQYPVIGQGGQIVIPAGANVEITQDGDIKADGVVVDRLRVIMPESQQNFERVTGSIFKMADNDQTVTDVEDPRLIQGYVETSNADISKLMMDMIIIEKNQEIISRIVRDRDTDLTKAQELGKL